MIRPIRGWIALPDADPELVWAATHHVVLSCVTAASRYGLWVREPPAQPHVAAPNRGAKIRSAQAVVHWSTPVTLRERDALCDPIEHVLQHVADCQPEQEARTIWESALNKRLVDVHALKQLKYSLKALHLLDSCTPLSDSGLESILASWLRWLPAPVQQQVHIAGHRVDLLSGDRLVIQVDGATHTGPQRDADIAHDAALRLLGYTVIRLSYRQVMYEAEAAQRLILNAIARGLHLA